MDKLTEFERAAIRKIIETDLAGDPGYINQLDGAVVTKREFTGAGLYVDVRPADGSTPVEPAETKTVSTWAQFEVPGDPNSYGMVLFIENGLITLLECFSYGNSFPVDISRFKFLGSGSDDERAVRDEEATVIEAMLADTAYASKFVPLDRSLTRYKMNDGGMGSLRFVTNRSRGAKYGKRIAEAHYTDSDGIPVLITINIDQYGDLFELDVWKVDYTPLKRWPKPEDLRPPEVNRPAT